MFVASGTSINFLDVSMWNTRRVGLTCSVRYYTHFLLGTLFFVVGVKVLFFYFVFGFRIPPCIQVSVNCLLFAYSR